MSFLSKIFQPVPKYNGIPDTTKEIIGEFNIEYFKATDKYYPKRDDNYFYRCSSYSSGYALVENLNMLDDEYISKSSYEEAKKFIDEYIIINYSGSTILPYIN